MEKVNTIKRQPSPVARALSRAAARGGAAVMGVLACALSLSAALPAAAQSAPRTIRGYYRIQNGLGVTQAEGKDKKYVIQTDMVYGAPKFSADSAAADAGSVFFVKATEVHDVYGLPAGSFRIDSLRSQGVELVGGLSDPATGAAVVSHSFLDYWNNPYKDLTEEYIESNPANANFGKHRTIHQRAWREAREIGYLKVARWLIESFIYNTAVGLTTATSGEDEDSVVTDGTKKDNILEVTKRYNTELADALDIDAYLVPTTLSTGETAYYVMWRPIDWKKVTDFFKQPDNMALFQDGLYAMDSYMSWVASAGESLEYNEIPLLMKLGYDLYDDILDDEGLTTGDYPAGWYRGRSLGQPSGGRGLDWPNGGACQISYETIFTHPKLLFGWVKMALYKMMLNPYGYQRAIRHFGGEQLYDLFYALGQTAPFMSYFCRYPYYDSRTTTPDWDIYLIDGFVSKEGKVTAKQQTDELYPGDTYKDAGRFGFYFRKHQTVDGVDTDQDYYDYSVYKSYVDPITNAYLPNQWWPATPTDYRANGGTTAAEHRRYWNQWFKGTVLRTYQQGLNDSEAVSPTSHVSGGLLDSQIKDGAKWVLKPVDASQPLRVVPSRKAQGLLDGHYYTSLYVDFPIDVKACSTGMRFYTVGDEVRTGRDGNGNEYSYVDIAEIKDVVPARQPVIVETTSTNAVDCQVVPAADNGKTARSVSLLQGVFFNVGKSNATPGLDRLTNWVDWSATAEYWLTDWFGQNTPAGVLSTRYAIPYDADTDQLYTLQKHQASASDRNPMGFYPYTGTALSKNKVFMVQDKTAAGGAKISLGGSDITDGIGEVKNEEGRVKDQSAIYDLQGRRVAKPVSGGVYVVGGRKVLVTK